MLALILQHLAVTLIALSLVRDRTSGVIELFRVAPVNAWELLAGKVIAYGILGGAIAASTVALLTVFFHVPMLGDPALLAGVIALVILASLGLGLLIAVISDSERQAVQLSLLSLLFERAQWRAPSPQAWAAIAYNAVLIFGFAHAAWFTLVRALPPVASTLSVMMIPVLGVFSGALWLGEVLRWQDWAAVLLMVAAIASVLAPSRAVAKS